MKTVLTIGGTIIHTYHFGNVIPNYITWVKWYTFKLIGGVLFS